MSPLHISTQDPEENLSSHLQSPDRLCRKADAWQKTPA